MRCTEGNDQCQDTIIGNNEDDDNDKDNHEDSIMCIVQCSESGSPSILSDRPNGAKDKRNNDKRNKNKRGTMTKEEQLQKSNNDKRGKMTREEQ